MTNIISRGPELPRSIKVNALTPTVNTGWDLFVVTAGLLYPLSGQRASKLLYRSVCGSRVGTHTVFLGISCRAVRARGVLLISSLSSFTSYCCVVVRCCVAVSVWA